MGFFEKYVNSRFYTFADAFYKFLVINLLMLITIVLGLGVFGLPVAIFSGVMTMKLISRPTVDSTFKFYFKTVKKCIRKLWKPMLVFTLLILVLGFNSIYFWLLLDEQFQMFHLISFMIMFFLFVLTLVSYIHGVILSVLYDLTIVSLIKNSYLLTIAFIIRTFIFLLICALIIYISLLVPLFGVLLGLSLFVFAAFKLLIQPYKKIESLSNDFNELFESIY